jgi:hypothetical protein
MAMSTGFLNDLADYGGTLINYIGLVDDVGTEISGGSYARVAVSWTAANDGKIEPSSDLVFEVPAGTTVAGWRGYSTSTGDTNYGGADFTAEEFTNAGQFKLEASGTYIDLDVAV